MIALFFATIWQLILLVRMDRLVWQDGLVEPWFVVNGLIFHKDFFSTYLPLPKFLMIPINMLTNWNYATTIVLGFILVILTIYFIQRLTLKITNNKGAGNLAVFFFSAWYMFLLQQYVFDINLLLGFLVFLTFYIFVDWVEAPTTKKVYLMGIFGACAVFTIQHALIPISIIYFIAFVKHWTSSRSIKQAILKVFMPLLLSGVIVILPILVWYYSRDSLADFYFWAIAYYFRDTGYPFTRLGFSFTDIFHIACFIMPLIAFKVILVESKFKGKKAWIANTLWAILFASIIYALFAIFHRRRLMFILPFMSVAAAFVYDEFFKLKHKLAKYLILGFAGLGLVCMVGTILPWYVTKIKTGTKVDFYNVAHVGDPEYSAIAWLKANTQQTDSLFVLTGNPLNFFEIGRLPANNRTYAIPWAYEPLDQMKKVMEEQPADYWMVDERLLGRFLEWGYPKQVEFIKDLLKRRYKEVARYEEWMVVYKKIN